MVVIRYCSVGNNKETNLYLQVSPKSKDGPSFHINNGFHMDKNNRVLLLTNPRVTKKDWINEDHIVSMMCKSGYFYC